MESVRERRQLKCQSPFGEWGDKEIKDAGEDEEMKKENFFSEARGKEDRKGGSEERLSKPTSDDPNHPGEVGARSSAERGRLGWRQRLKNCDRDWIQSVECQQKLCCGWPGITH